METTVVTALLISYTIHLNGFVKESHEDAPTWFVVVSYLYMIILCMVLLL